MSIGDKVTQNPTYNYETKNIWWQLDFTKENPNVSSQWKMKMTPKKK